MGQVADRFYTAVRKLATEGPAKQRLISAYMSHLEGLSVQEVPDTIQARFAALQRAMTAVAATEKETAVQVSVRKMSQAETTRFSRSILAMFAELVRVKTTGERLNSGYGTKVPAPGFNNIDPSIRVPNFLAR